MPAGGAKFSVVRNAGIATLELKRTPTPPSGCFPGSRRWSGSWLLFVPNPRAIWQESCRTRHIGGTFAVRLELGIAHEFANRTRLGIRWGHVSNAYVYEQNPSEEEYLITYARPF